MKNELITKVILISILILALGLRIYKLNSVPPSISWDEAAFGVNAYYLANYGRDEYGKAFPLFFKSFGDDKHPVHIYITAIFVKALGLNEFSVRLPSALFGTLNILLLYFLGKIFFKRELISLSAALFLAISPYSIHFSRFNHEANFVLFFFLLSLIFFMLSLDKKNYLLPLSVFTFGITFISYHNAKVIVPIVVIILAFSYFKKIIQNRKGLLTSALICLLFFAVIFLNPQLLGIARASQNALDSDEIEKTYLYQKTGNKFLGHINLVINQYAMHFNPHYLFTAGDKNARLSSQRGQFYRIDAIFLTFGLFYLIYKRSRVSFILLIWALSAPLPASLVKEAPHAARASFMMGSWHLISAAGFYYLLSMLKKPLLKIGLIIILLIILLLSLLSDMRYYFGEYAERYAIEWQYGMKQIVEYVDDHPEYNQVYMTDARHQPYIFFLFYLKTPLPEYLNTVVFNRSEGSKDYNLISYYDKYFFGGWDTVESMPQKDVLYILTPTEYDGLRHKNEFDVKKLVKYPNGTDAFYLVSKD